MARLSPALKALEAFALNKRGSGRLRACRLSDKPKGRVGLSRSDVLALLTPITPQAKGDKQANRQVATSEALPQGMETQRMVHWRVLTACDILRAGGTKASLLRFIR